MNSSLHVTCHILLEHSHIPSYGRWVSHLGDTVASGLQHFRTYGTGSLAQWTACLWGELQSAYVILVLRGGALDAGAG